MESTETRFCKTCQLNVVPSAEGVCPGCQNPLLPGSKTPDSFKLHQVEGRAVDEIRKLTQSVRRKTWWSLGLGLSLILSLAGLFVALEARKDLKSARRLAEIAQVDRAEVSRTAKFARLTWIPIILGALFVALAIQSRL